mgnify:FL=1
MSNNKNRGLLWLIIIVLTAFTIGYVMSDKMENKDVQYIPPPTLEERWLRRVLPVLKQQESGGDPYAINEEDAKKTGYPSIGCYQYQPPTFIEKIKQHDLLPGTEEKEYMNWINDCEFQEELTKLVLLEPNGWKHWYTSFMSLNLPRNPKEGSSGTKVANN